MLKYGDFETVLESEFKRCFLAQKIVREKIFCAAM